MYLFPGFSDEENRKIGYALERCAAGPLQAQYPDYGFKLRAGRKRLPSGDRPEQTQPRHRRHSRRMPHRKRPLSGCHLRSPPTCSRSRPTPPTERLVLRTAGTPADGVERSSRSRPLVLNPCVRNRPSAPAEPARSRWFPRPAWIAPRSSGIGLCGHRDWPCGLAGREPATR